MSSDITPIVRPSSATRLITDAVDAARALGLTVSTDADLGVMCTSTIAPRWERDPRAAGISPLGCVLLAHQPAIPDADSALVHVLGTRVAFQVGIEDGCSGADTKAGALKASDRQLYLDSFLLGVQLRTLITTVPCETHLVRFPRGERCPDCQAAVPVLRSPLHDVSAAGYADAATIGETTDRMQIDTPRSVIAELLNMLTPAQGLEALADSCRARAAKLTPDLAEDLAVVEFTLREMAADVRGIG